MSRIGKQPVEIADGVKVEIKDKKVVISGPRGELELSIPREVSVSQKDNELLVETKKDSSRAKAFQGTIRSHLVNMVHGVTEGWQKNLELEGTGYRAEGGKDKLKLTVGFSHPVVIEAPEGIGFEVEKTKITVKGASKELVGLIAAKIRSVRPPEPYKGKGIKYKDEVIQRKPGKAAKGEGAGAATGV